MLMTELMKTDAEFMDRFHNFAFDEVINEKSAELEVKPKMMAILSTLIGCQGLDEFKIMLSEALKLGVTPIEVKEIVYQAVAYLGMGRVLPFLYTVNDVLISSGYKLPLKEQSTTTMDNRLEKGIQSQVDIFGEGMREFYKSGTEECRHINKWLAANCFGDYYTRNGLDYRQREMITFCFLAAQGGCELQLTSHAMANMRIGNDKHLLIRVISQCVPYIGYPRSLNALRCINDAAKQIETGK
ncbi:carboxymuconolactone decarboxylase family protein [Tepidibacter aestuarii]|uniref:carboxymuconolactone decarboxylase family protein n=1 Tax=Tepidibacter aestuarii TaxID=2925782 RepID=UPI0020C0E60C|nr:carboxymuconolactone decarboxylase family protein [Tepidibacter aestuarii]CAH2213565.1 4-carboxymuconolactone decarboxylase [Tepidibacter aestuarii]